METTDYCDYKLSLALKAAGFNEPCIAQWACEPDGKPILLGSTAFVFSNAELKGRDVTAPLLSHAQKWLREKYRHEVNAIWSFEESAWFAYSSPMNRPQIMCADVSDTSYPTYEQALSEGIKSALELIKKGE